VVSAVICRPPRGLHVQEEREGLVSFLPCRPTFHKISEKFTGLGWAGHIAGMAANKQVCKSNRVSLGDPRLDEKIILKWILGPGCLPVCSVGT
jgi:hypothetical protein